MDSAKTASTTPLTRILATSSLARPSESGDSFTFRCPACTKLLLLDRKYAGLEGPCPKCSQLIISADPLRGKEARLTEVMPAPAMGRRTFSPPVYQNQPTDASEMPVRKPKPPPMGKEIARIEDMQRQSNAVNLTAGKRQRRSFSEKLSDPNTLSWMRTILSLLAIAAIIAGIFVLRSRGH